MSRVCFGMWPLNRALRPVVMSLVRFYGYGFGWHKDGWWPAQPAQCQTFWQLNMEHTLGNCAKIKRNLSISFATLVISHVHLLIRATTKHLLTCCLSRLGPGAGVQFVLSPDQKPRKIHAPLRAGLHMLHHVAFDLLPIATGLPEFMVAP